MFTPLESSTSDISNIKVTDQQPIISPKLRNFTIEFLAYDYNEYPLTILEDHSIITITNLANVTYYFLQGSCTYGTTLSIRSSFYVILEIPMSYAKTIKTVQ